MHLRAWSTTRPSAVCVSLMSMESVLATQRYGNDQNGPSRAALTALPALPEGRRNRPGPDDPEALTLPLARLDPE